MSKHPKTGRFLTGNSGGGRPKGARNKLGEAFLEDIYAAWREHGAAAINEVVATRPQDFLRVVASLMPKEITAEMVPNRYVARLPEKSRTTEEWLRQVPKPTS